MGVLGTRVIFIGPDCGGKSTLATLMAKELSVPLSQHRKMKDDLEALVSVSTDALVARNSKHTTFVRDQWPFPVDILYQRTMGGGSSILSGISGYLGVTYRKAGVIFVYVTASEEEIAKRFEARGDELWDLDQIKKVAKDYENFFARDELKLHMIRVDTTGRNPEEQVHEVIASVESLRKELEEAILCQKL